MKPTPTTRYSLIERIRSPEDAEAWTEFTSIYQPVIFGICKSKGMQHADATDVTQEVMARVASAIEKFDPTHSRVTFRGWLYRVTQNLVTDFFRKNEKNVLANASPELPITSELRVESQESQQFALNFKRQVFVVVAKKIQSQAAQNTWRAFWETEVEQRPVEDVARELDMTTGSVYVARSRIIARMRKEVQKRLSETTSFQD